MNKLLVGVIVGAILGALDGLTAWFTPDVRSMLGSIVMGSTMKGVLVGVVSGWFARKVESNMKGIILGAVLGLLLAWGVAAMPDPSGKHYYMEIMIPGFITGAIIGFLTQRWGQPAARNSVRAAKA